MCWACDDDEYDWGPHEEEETEMEEVDVNSRVAQEFKKVLETDAVKAEVERRVALMKGYGEDSWPVGTVFRFTRTFVNSFNAYQYAALKAGNGKWYVTGVDALTHGMSWGEFLTWMVGHPTAYPVGVAQVDVVSGWKIYEGN